MKNSLLNIQRNVELFGIAFPRITQTELLEYMLNKLNHHIGAAVCFPDMSTMNLIAEDRELQKIVSNSFESFNDGAGLAIAARFKGKPFPDNLNGTDFIPIFLANVKKGTRVFLVGGRENILKAALNEMKKRFPDINFVGAHHGYFESMNELYVGAIFLVYLVSL